MAIAGVTMAERLLVGAAGIKLELYKALHCAILKRMVILSERAGLQVWSF